METPASLFSIGTLKATCLPELNIPSLGLVTLPPLTLSELGVRVSHSSEVQKTVRSHSLTVSLCPYLVNSFIKTLQYSD